MSQDTIERNRVAGTVRRVVTKNDEDGWVILDVEIRRGESLKVRGKAPGVNTGQYIEAFGANVYIPEWGRQFAANEIRVSQPVTPEAIITFLSSKIFRGVGPKKAEQIVAHFGQQTLDVLDREPERLAELPGMTPKIRQTITSAWRSQRNQRNTVLRLSSLGLGTALQARVLAKFGSSIEDILRDNPYRLTSVSGIGFRKADEVAQRSGIARDSIFRMRSAVTHVLLSAMREESHCALPAYETAFRAAELTGLTDNAYVPVINEMIRAGDIINDMSTHEPLLFTRRMHAIETALARHLGRLARCQRIDRTTAEEAVGKAVEQTGARLDQDQMAAAVMGTIEPVSVIYGGPGTGKSTICRVIKIACEILGQKIIAVAPTAQAANRLAETTGLEASTVHRLLQWDPASGFFLHNENNPLPSNSLIIADEGSMLDAHLAACLVRAVPSSSRLLLLGDEDQLPSVGPGKFIADVKASGVIPTAKLTKIYRQAANSRIVRGAHAIRQGRMPALDEGPNATDVWFFPIKRTQDAIPTITRLVQNELRAKGFGDPAQFRIMSPIWDGGAGVNSINRAVQNLINPAGNAAGLTESCDGAPTPRVGGRVIQTTNNYDKCVFNGDVGTVLSIDSDPASTVTVLFDRCAEPVIYDSADTSQLRVAYCTTVHAGQGSEYPVAILVITSQAERMLTRKLLFTGWTRARELLIVVGQHKAIQEAVDTNHDQRRYTLLRNRLQSLIRPGNISHAPQTAKQFA